MGYYSSAQWGALVRTGSGLGGMAGRTHLCKAGNPHAQGSHLCSPARSSDCCRGSEGGRVEAVPAASPSAHQLVLTFGPLHLGFEDPPKGLGSPPSELKLCCSGLSYSAPSLGSSPRCCLGVHRVLGKQRLYREECARKARSWILVLCSDQSRMGRHRRHERYCCGVV